MELVVVYDLAADERRVRIYQEASLADGDLGLSPKPHLVGSADWWEALASGGLPRGMAEGTISEVAWGSEGDWPEFALRDDEGSVSAWTREGDVSRYVVGLRARVTWTRHPLKRMHPVVGSTCDVVVKIEIAPSDLRSDPWLPDPGGVARRRAARGRGR